MEVGGSAGAQVSTAQAASEFGNKLLKKTLDQAESTTQTLLSSVQPPAAPASGPSHLGNNLDVKA